MLALLCHCPPSTGLRVQLFAETSLRSAFPVLKYRTALLCTAVRPPSRFHWRQPARLVCTQVYCHPMAAMEDTTSNTRGSPFVVVRKWLPRPFHDAAEPLAACAFAGCCRVCVWVDIVPH